jgi:hypothetical protein
LFRKKSEFALERRDSYRTCDDYNSAEISRAISDDYNSDDDRNEEPLDERPFTVNHKFKSKFDNIERPNREIKVSKFKPNEEEKRLSTTNDVAHNKSESTAHTSGFQSAINNKYELANLSMPIIEEEDGGQSNAKSIKITKQSDKSRMNYFDDNQSVVSKSMLSSLAPNRDTDGCLVNVKKSKR